MGGAAERRFHQAGVFVAGLCFTERLAAILPGGQLDAMSGGTLFLACSCLNAKQEEFQVQVSGSNDTLPCLLVVKKRWCV